MMTRFGALDWRATVADAGRVAIRFKFIGELSNEDKILTGGEESAELSIKGDYPKKACLPASLLAAEAVAAHSESLTKQFQELYGRIGKLESRRFGGPQLMQSLGDKLKVRGIRISNGLGGVS